MKGRVTKTGYRRNSPDVNNDYNVIPSNRISMAGVDFPVLGIDNLGNSELMYPGGEYEFQGDYVTELPAYGSGGLTQWFAEKWVDIKTGKECGRSGKDKNGRPYPACRPSKRVNSTTPKTSKEMSAKEKAKFKKSKTSGKRINYNHKRAQEGIEVKPASRRIRYEDGRMKLQDPAIYDGMLDETTVTPYTQSELAWQESRANLATGGLEPVYPIFDVMTLGLRTPATAGAKAIQAGIKKAPSKIAKGYNKIATGNSALPVAWKVEKSVVPKSSQYINGPYTKAQSELLADYGRGMDLTPQQWSTLEEFTKSGATKFSGDFPISRVLGYYTGPTAEAQLINNLRVGQRFSAPAEKTIRTWSAGLPSGGIVPENSTRLVIPSRYTKNLGNNFAGMNYGDKANNFIWGAGDDGMKILNAAAVGEKELMGNLPKGFRVIGKSTEQGLNNIFIKPIKEYGGSIPKAQTGKEPSLSRDEIFNIPRTVRYENGKMVLQDKPIWDGFLNEVTVTPYTASEYAWEESRANLATGGLEPVYPIFDIMTLGLKAPATAGAKAIQAGIKKAPSKINPNYYNPDMLAKGNRDIMYRQVGKDAYQDFANSGFVRTKSEITDNPIFGLLETQKEIKDVLRYNKEYRPSQYRHATDFRAPFFSRGKTTAIKDGGADYLIQTRPDRVGPDNFYSAQWNILHGDQPPVVGGFGIMDPMYRGADGFDVFKKSWWHGYKPIKQDGGEALPTAQKGREQATISAYEEPAWYEKAADYLASPMTALSYIVQGKDLPDRLPINVENRNAYDMAIDMINPAAWYAYAESADRNIAEGNYTAAAFDALGAIPVVPAWLAQGKNATKAGKNVIKNAAKYTDEVFASSDDIAKTTLKDAKPRATRFDAVTEVNPLSQAQARNLAEQGRNAEIFKAFEEGANTIDDFVKSYTGDLSSPEGFKRLVQQEADYLRSIGFDEARIATQAEINAGARLNEIINIGNRNKAIVQGERSAESIVKRKNNFNNASYTSAPLGEYIDDLFYIPGTDISNAKFAVNKTKIGAKVTPGQVNLGTMFNSSRPVAAHEIGGHGLQSGRSLPVDSRLQKLEPLDELNDNAKAAYDYFLTGSKGREPSAFLHELRQAMLDNKLIRNRYDYVSPEQLQRFQTLFNLRPSGTVNTMADKFHSSTRILDFMKPTKSNFNLLATELNKLPAIVPVGVAGAAGAAALPQEKYGGSLHKAQKGIELGNRFLPPAIRNMQPKEDPIYYDGIVGETTVTAPRYKGPQIRRLLPGEGDPINSSESFIGADKSGGLSALRGLGKGIAKGAKWVAGVKSPVRNTVISPYSAKLDKTLYAPQKVYGRGMPNMDAEMTMRGELIEQYNARNNAYHTVNITDDIRNNEYLRNRARTYGYNPDSDRDLALFLGTSPGGVGRRTGYENILPEGFDFLYSGNNPIQTFSRYGQFGDNVAPFTTKFKLFNDNSSMLSDRQLFERIQGLDGVNTYRPDLGIKTLKKSEDLSDMVQGQIINTNSLHVPGLNQTNIMVGRKNIPVRDPIDIRSAREMSGWPGAYELGDGRGQFKNPADYDFYFKQTGGSIPKAQTGRPVGPPSLTPGPIQDKVYPMITGPVEDSLENRIINSPPAKSKKQVISSTNGVTVDPDRLRKGIKYAESLNGTLMMNPESTATGFYGQLFSEVKGKQFLKNIDRETFAADTALQNQVFNERLKGNEELFGIKKGLIDNGIDIYNEYKPILKDKLKYSPTELAALSNMLGRQGARNYVGYVLRDGKTLAEALPNIYGPDAKYKNHTPEEYIEKFNKAFDSGKSNVSPSNDNVKMDMNIYDYQEGGESIPSFDIYDTYQRAWLAARKKLGPNKKFIYQGIEESTNT